MLARQRDSDLLPADELNQIAAFAARREFKFILDIPVRMLLSWLGSQTDAGGSNEYAEQNPKRIQGRQKPFPRVQRALNRRHFAGR
jgi:hypothetical protein